VRVLREHPAVLADPEPMVLVEQLGASTVVPKPCFWVNIREHSMFKVRSAVIRLVKRAFQDAGISMPDEAREMIFPQGVPVRMVSAEEQDGEPRQV
jgi:small-conductance mechanosensitive channel